jgi:hypothetical protein
MGTVNIMLLIFSKLAERLSSALAFSNGSKGRAQGSDDP